MRRLLAILLLIAWPMNGWWDEGHEVVARIAAMHLTPITQAQVAALLEVENNPQALAEALAKAAVWADQINNEAVTAHWHFLNLAWQDSRANIAERCESDDCLTVRLRLFAAQLKANHTEEEAQFNDTDALRFLVHLVGDLHQPLHMATNSDQNGNCLPLADWIEGAQNLHALWDGPLVSRMGTDAAALAAELNTEIAGMGDGDRAEWVKGDIEDWAWDAHRLALQHVYRRLKVPKAAVAFPASCDAAPEEIQQQRIVIDEAYLDEVQPVVREQLKKAGLRLARMLNEILD